MPDWLARVFPGGAIGLAETLIIAVTVCSFLIILLNIYSLFWGLGVGSDGTPSSRRAHAPLRWMFARPRAMMLAHSQASQTPAPTAAPVDPTCPSGGE